MKSRSLGLLLGGTLVLGIGIGVVSQSVSLPEVEANGLTAAEVRTISDELSRREGSLWDASAMLSKIAKKAGPSVVHIESRYTGPRGNRVEETGSGVIVRSDRKAGLFVITNRHVVDGAALSGIAIRLADGRELHPLDSVTDAATDLAVLRLGITDAIPAELGDSDRIDIGHMVLAMGSPFGLSKSVTLGIISAKARRRLSLGENSELSNQNFLQTDAAINPGNSGGPLIDLHGRVIGINTAIASNSGGSEGIGFSIPSNLVRHIVNELLTNGRVRRAYLGVKLDPKFNLATANRLGMNRVQGARVLSVLPGTAAARARLQYDDIVLSINGRGIEDEDDLVNRVSLMPVGSNIVMEVLRGRRRVRLTISLTERPAQITRDPKPETTKSSFRVHPTAEETAVTEPAPRTL